MGCCQFAFGGFGTSPSPRLGANKVLSLGAGLPHPLFEPPLRDLDPLLGRDHSEMSFVRADLGLLWLLPSLSRNRTL